MSNPSTSELTTLLTELKEKEIKLWLENGKVQVSAPKGAMTATLREQMMQNRDDLRTFLNQQSTEQTIQPADRNGTAPLSYAQQQLWVLMNLDNESAAYNVPTALRLQGKLDIPSLEESLQHIFSRHEILRTTFPLEDGDFVQHIEPAPSSFSIPQTDLTHLAPDERDARLEQAINTAAGNPFDLENGPLTITHLFRLADNEHVLFLNQHHIVIDGWSTGILIHELSTTYRALSAGSTIDLEPLPIQYADYAIWQNDWLQGAAYQQRLAYWADLLEGAPSLLEFPTDHLRPSVQSAKGSSVSSDISLELSRRVQQYSVEQESTAQMTLMAAYLVLLARYSGSTDLVVGVPVANRPLPELEPLIGFFVNTLPVRFRIELEDSFAALVQQVKESMLAAYARQDVPFEQIVERVKPERSLSYAPIFQVVFNLTAMSADDLTLPDLTIELVAAELNAAKHDLTLDVNLIGDEIEIEWQYSTDLFDAETVARIGQHLLEILQHGLTDPEQPIGKLPLLTEQERIQMLTEWNGVGNAPGNPTEADFPLHQPVHELISRHAQTTPNEPALIYTDRDGVDHQLTFAEYNAAANQVAHYLQGQGVTVGTPVGICAERSLDVMVGILGIMKSGGVYVPLDPDYPEDRLQQTIGDSQMALLLTQSHLVSKFEWSDVALFTLDDSAETLASFPATLPAQTAASDDGIYIIFTSGSTGKPKGVLASHRGVANLALGLGQEIGVETGDRLLQFAPFSFDASALQMFVPLVNGGTLVLHHDPTKLSAQELMDYASRQRMTLLDLPAALWRQWVADMSDMTLVLPSSVRFFLTGGEAVPAETLRQWAHLSPREVQFLSSYGPTEASITTTIFRSSNNELANVQEADLTIGRPLPNTSVYLIDEAMNLVPIGVHGEIYIGGVGVTKGYLNDEELTAGKFIDNPFAPGQLYRTGDWGRFRPNGDIEFLGRMDNQVKIRGFRIELGEIEAVLSTHPAVQDVIVTAPADENGRKQLAAYVVPTALVDDQIDRVEIRNYVAAHLPNHMVPAAFMQLDSMPLLPNGKVDRKALPAPTTESLTRSAKYVAAASDTEETLAEIWKTLLGVESVGVHDNFFELGGDSIIGIQFIGRARDAGIHLTARDLFEHQTIAELTQVASTESAAITEQGLVIGSVPLTPIQHWFFNQNGPEPHHFNQSNMLTVPAAVTAAQVERVVGQLLDHHDALRAVFSLTDDGWTQEFTALPERIPVEEIDLSRPNGTSIDQTGRIESTAAALQRSLNLEEGPLLKAILMRLGADQPSRLLLVAHHLVVDGVSWRILLEDLQNLFMQVQGGAADLQLPAKSTSYRQWADWLSNDAIELVADQRGYWHSVVEDAAQPLPRHESERATEASSVSFESVLDADTTARLLTEAHAPYRTQINDLLLSALALAITKWSGDNQLLLALEGHGRTDLSDTIDLSRTVGWFTNQYPLRLDVGQAVSQPDGADMGQLIRSVKEQIRAVPNNGIGYNILRYMDADSVLNAHQTPEILFNYLGQTEAGMNVDEESDWGGAPESMGEQISPAMGLLYPLEINGLIVDGSLLFNWSFVPNLFDEAQIAQVAHHFNQALREIVDHCAAAEARYTPSDFPLATITQPELDQLVTRYPNAEAIYDATRAQAGMFFHSLMAPNSGVYILQSQLTLAAGLDTERLQHAFNCLIQRHTLLRTAFVSLDRQIPLQVVLSGPLAEHSGQADIDCAIPWTELDWRNLDDFESRYAALIQQDQLVDFEPEKAPLMRVTLIQAPDGNYRLLWTTHHVITDGWSTAILFSELVQFYQAGGEELTELELPPAIPFENYVAWLGNQQPNAAIDFWSNNLAGFTEPTPLFDDAAPASHDAIRNAAHTVELTGKPFQQLDAATRRERITMSTLVQGVWSLLLSRYSQQDDVVVGITVSGRPADLPGAEEMMGMFLNILPLRVELDHEAALWPWLRSIQERYVEADRFSYMPLHDIQQLSEMSGGRNLFESLIVFQNYPTGDDAIEAVDSDGALLLGFDAHEQTNFPITLFVSTSTEADGHETDAHETDGHEPESGGLLHLNIQYDANRFGADRIAQIAEQLTSVLARIAEMADGASAGHGPATLSQVELLTEAEQHQLLVDWNQTTADYPRHETLISLFDQRVKEMPGAVALIDGKNETTYAMLNYLANQIAGELVQRGVTKETLVGICVERSPAMVAALLGVLKVGGAYVPLDPSYPTDRLNYMLADSGANVLITSSAQSTEQPDNWFAVNQEKSLQVLDLALLGSLDASNSDDKSFALSYEIRPDDLAYVIYTSGSTGQPKGVQAMHRGAMNRLYWMWREMPFGPGEVAAQKTALSFVDSIWEIFGPLLHGVPSVLIPNNVVKDTELFIETLAEYHVSRLVLVPSLLQAMLETNPQLDQQLPALKGWICSGETLTGHLADRFRRSMPQARMINLYGSSEVAADVTWFDALSIDAEATFGAKNVPIGRPIDNTQIYLLDKQMRLVPMGAMGEIYVGGENLARGYHNQPQLTDERFVNNPFGPGKLYYMADWGRYQADGAIEFLGRRDSQVKIRGFRVELGEVEATLQRHAAVREAVVEAKPLADSSASQQLVAYIVPEAASDFDSTSLRAELATTLPDYMVPALFVQLDEMPLLPNGKVNRHNLPMPDSQIVTGVTEYVAPSTSVEQTLVEIWADVLGFGPDEIGIHHDFFELGGHSLIATQLISRIRRAFDADISLRDIFQEPTIAQLSQQIAVAEKSASLPPITRADRTSDLPLSFAQERLWFLMMYDPSSIAYNMPNALRLHGAFEPSALEASLGQLLDRHESLRTIFPLVDGDPVQLIQPTPGHFNLPFQDLSHLATAEREAEAQRVIQAEAVRPFDIENGPLFRILLVKLSDGDHILFTNMHHIITDGWSNDIFIHELITLYQNAVAGSAIALPPLPFQYADYAQWQRTWLNDEILEEQIGYWQTQLTGAPDLLELTGDRPRPLVPTYQSQTLSYEIEPELVHKLEAVGRQHGATLFMTLLSAFGVLLHRYSRQDEVVIGSPIANRNHPDLEGLIGFFVNTLALRIDMAERPTFAALLSRVHNMTMDAYANQDAPFAQIVERLPLDREVSYNPIYQVMFALQNTPPMSTAGIDADELVASHGRAANGASAAPLTVAPVEAERGANHHDLMLLLSEDGDGLSGTLEFNLDIFNTETVAHLLDNFTRLLHSIADQPSQPIDTLNMLGDSERKLLVETRNDHSQPYPADKHVAQLFEEQAALRPESVALVFGGEEMTYAALNSQANRLANHLFVQGVEPGARIGLCTERSFEMVVASLAILKAGCAYVPLDPSYPEERLHLMIQDTDMKLILVQDQLLDRLGTYSGARFSLDADWSKLGYYSDANPVEEQRPQAGPQGLAYIMYTSGSTGKPKGAAIPHQAIVRLVKETNFMALDANQTFLQLAPISFDASTLELWGSLLNGGKLVIMAPGQPRLEEIAETLVNQDISALWLTSALFNMMVDEHLDQLVMVQQVLTGGEALTVDKVNRHLAAMPDGHRLVNGYGPTENTTFTTCFPMSNQTRFGSSVPIGRPIGHTSVYILDEQMQPTPAGVPGELYAGGDGLALGYWDRTELTAERFVPNPFGKGKLYKTGDLVRYLPSGDIEFIGRIDAQVKIRGHRIELGEIEHQLALHPDVHQVVVLAREDVPGEKILVAYIVTVPEAVWGSDDYRAAIAEALPAYMVPNIYIPIDAIPINPNGKIDRKALPAPDASTLANDTDYVPPANYLEEQLVELWGQLFDMDASLIGTNHSFFELGGHSLIAAKNVTQIDETFGVSVSLRRFFEEPTLAGLGEIIYTDLIDGVTPEEFAQIMAEVEVETKNGN